MAGDKTIQVPRVKLGSQGFEVSKLGFGTLGLGPCPLPEEDKISIITDVFNKGITFIDSADVYGTEEMIGKALKQFSRDKIQVATKCGLTGFGAHGVLVNCTPEYVRSCCEASLKKLDAEYIDLFYMHRVDTSTPIEVTMGELKKLVEEGKIKYIGLSEASPDTIRRAHAVHPITAVEMEWSLWTRDIEEEIVPLCRELGIGIVPYSPLGLGFFAGKVVVESVPEDSLLNSHPRLTGDNLEKNKNVYYRIEKIAKKHKRTPAQVALAWILQQGDDVVPIPGTTKIKNLDDNIGALALKLTKEDLKEISEAVPLDEIAGNRTFKMMQNASWKVSNTPQKECKA